MKSPETPLFDDRLAQPIKGGLSICLATRGPGNLPNLARAIGCAVSLGYPEPLVRTLLGFQPEDLLRITFPPTSGFLQTPGQNAGAPLGGPP